MLSARNLIVPKELNGPGVSSQNSRHSLIDYSIGADGFSLRIRRLKTASKPISNHSREKAKDDKLLSVPRFKVFILPLVLFGMRAQADDVGLVRRALANEARAASDSQQLMR